MLYRFGLILTELPVSNYKCNNGSQPKCNSHSDRLVKHTANLIIRNPMNVYDKRNQLVNAEQ